MKTPPQGTNHDRVIRNSVCEGDSKHNTLPHSKYTDEDRYKIGKYVSENNSAATVQKFKSDFPRLNESTVCDFKRKYENTVRDFKEKG